MSRENLALLAGLSDIADWSQGSEHWLAMQGRHAGPGRPAMVDSLLDMAYQNRIELVQGTLDLLILQTLQWGSMHGHGIGQTICARTEGVLEVEHGSLYPALHRLERQGWIAGEWKESEAKRRAKYYALTPLGKKQLLAEQSRWKQLVRAVARTVKPVRN